MNKRTFRRAAGFLGVAAVTAVLVGAGVSMTGAFFQDTLDIYADHIVGLALVPFLIGLVYAGGFLRWRGATPGKMVCGLQVRLRERPGPLPWGTVLTRWLMQNLGSAVAVVPLVGLLGWVYSLLDDLWPLWDGQRQALHDKAARTNVVRTR